ncbi:MAG: hypothetical protein NVV72_14680 [Asticcacaulis sp.]|nr:hypothetical protein [Asticcacaulis sp.]
MNDNQGVEKIEDLVERYMLKCQEGWTKQGLPVEVLATAALTWGMRLATAQQGSAAVAEGLQRVADEIMAEAHKNFRPST